jgi:NADPH2:quinone reductase
MRFASVGPGSKLEAMKAIVVSEFGPPEVLKLEDIPTPKPGPGQVLVRIETAGVNPVDAYIRSGVYPKLPQLPYTPGKDAAGVLEAVGEGVTGFASGDRVYTADSITGTYAEYALCGEHQVNRLPDNVSFEQGAGVFVPYATSYRALFQKAGAKTGETVLVHGASGGVGIAAIQWAKNAGLTVIGTASSDEGKRVVREQGADFVFDHTNVPEPSESGPTGFMPSALDEGGYLAEIKEATGGKGVDIILEMLANKNLQKDFEVLAMFGRISVIGNRGSLEFNPRAIMGKDASIFGMSLFNAPAGQMREIHEAIYKGLADGYLRPVVNETFPLGEAPKAHHSVIENKAAGKIVLKT